MIGTAIVQNPDVFAQTLANGGHIGTRFIKSKHCETPSVADSPPYLPSRTGTHTWSHPLVRESSVKADQRLRN